MQRDAHGATRLQISAATQGQHGRQLLRHEGPGPVPLDGRPQLAGAETVDRGRERDHVQVSRRSADARRAQEADHGAVQLPASHRPAIRGSPLVLLAQHGTAASVGRFRTRIADGSRARADRPEPAVARRLRGAVAILSVARRPAFSVRTGRRRIGLVDVLRAGAG